MYEKKTDKSSRLFLYNLRSLKNYEFIIILIEKMTYPCPLTV